MAEFHRPTPFAPIVEIITPTEEERKQTRRARIARARDHEEADEFAAEIRKEQN